MANKKSSGHGIAIAAGATAAIATLAGAYFLYGSKDAKKNRKAVKSWALKVKAEVLEKIERAKTLESSDYEKIVDTVTGKYSKMKDVNSKELGDLAQELKKHWKDISRDTKARAKGKK